MLTGLKITSQLGGRGLGGQLFFELWESRASVEGHVRRQVWNNMELQIRNQIFDQVNHPVQSHLRESF